MSEFKRISGEEDILVGDIIRDIEDTDCFYEGIVISLNPIKYKITNILWNGEEDDSMNGIVTVLRWWGLKKKIKE